MLDAFLDKYHEGCEVVYGVRNKRDTDTLFKRSTAQGFYKFMKMLGVDIVYNHADYRLMGKRALDALAQYKEVNLFLRGIVPEIGFKSGVVTYDRHERFAGESKYPLKKMLHFAVDGITSFSVRPLKIISNFGIFISLASIAGLLYALISHFMGPQWPAGRPLSAPSGCWAAFSCCVLGWWAAISEKSTARSNPPALPHRSPG